jgi:transposase
MTHFVGLDASKATTSICILDQRGEKVREGVVATEPKAIIGYLRGEGRRYRRIGIEAMAITPWIYEALAKAGLPIICIENRHAHGVLKARLNKTDRNDARGIAELMRAGLYKAVHVKTQASQHSKLLLSVRRLLKIKVIDLDNMIRAVLLQSGRKLKPGGVHTFERRVRALARGSGLVEQMVDALLRARGALAAEMAALQARITELAENDPVCRRLMTAPGVGHLTALAYRAAIDVPGRFTNSRIVAVHLGLTPKSRQSGTVEGRGRISRCGDGAVRSALHMSARVLMWGRTRGSALKSWGKHIAASRGYWKALVAVARKLAVILHRMWMTETDFERAARG